jgi:Zn finger protein HypA/HybF involved in hydrogenase expression
MNLRLRIIHDDGTEHNIEGIMRADWDSLTDPCPKCGGQEFDYFQVSGGHYGSHQGTIIERKDFWDANQPLFTRCRDCDEILYKHPAFDLLYSVEGNDDTVIKFNR